MQNIITLIKITFATIGGFLGMLIGGFDDFFKALLIFIILDYLTGVINAVIEKQLNSEIGFKGIAKKVFIIFLVGVANIIDTMVLKNGEVVRDIVIFFYLANEGISILENSAKIGLPIPEKLKGVLEQIKSKGE